MLVLACGGAPEDRHAVGQAQVDSAIESIPLSDLPHQALPARLVVDSPLYTIGINPRNDAEELGYVTEGILLADGSAVVGDLKRDRLVVVSPDGRAVTTFGREGEGPEEFQETSALLAGSGQRFTVIDNGLHRRLELAVMPEGIEVASSRRFDTQPAEVCQGSDGLVSLDYDPSTQRLLHHLDQRGRRDNSFGLPLVIGSNQLNNSLAQGELLCLPDRNAVMFAAMTGDLLMFDARTGAVIWRRKVPDFLPVSVQQRGEMVVFTYAPPPGNKAHFPAGLHRLDAERALLIVGVQERETLPDGKVRIFTSAAEARMIDIASGVQLVHQAPVPVILDLRDSLALIKGDDPEPWIGVSKVRLDFERDI